MQIRRWKTFVLATAFAAFVSMGAAAQDAAASGSKKAAKAGGASAGMDSKFVKEAAQGGMAEVDKGNLAKSKASNDAVKQFGDLMVTDHSKANDELKSLASNKGWTLPADLPPHEKAMHTRLDKLSGGEFDKAYMRDMVRDHEKDVAEFKKCAENCKDADLKAWAQKTVPTLETHLQKAKDAAKQVGGASSGKASSKSEKPTTTTSKKEPAQH